MAMTLKTPRQLLIRSSRNGSLPNSVPEIIHSSWEDRFFIVFFSRLRCWTCSITYDTVACELSARIIMFSSVEICWWILIKCRVFFVQMVQTTSYHHCRLGRPLRRPNWKRHTNKWVGLDINIIVVLVKCFHLKTFSRLNSTACPLVKSNNKTTYCSWYKHFNFIRLYDILLLLPLADTILSKQDYIELIWTTKYYNWIISVTVSSVYTHLYVN